VATAMSSSGGGGGIASEPERELPSFLR